jgi:uncharacterized protein
MIIADSGFWLALANSKDKLHVGAKTALKHLQEGLVVTWPVMTETSYLLRDRLGWPALKNFIQLYHLKFFSVFELSHDHSARILQLMETYRKLPMDLADASLVILAEHLRHGRILSSDRRDFGAYRWGNNRPFENLLC